MTPTQDKTLKFIRAYIETNGYSPNYVEIARGIGYNSQGRIGELLTALQNYGHLRYTPGNSRSITLVDPIENDLEEVIAKFDEGLVEASEAIEMVRTILIAREAFQ